MVRTRPAQPQDAEQLAVVHEASWRNAYEGLLPHGDLTRILNARSSAYWRRMSGRDRGLFVLEYEGRAVGYVNIGPCSRRALVLSHAIGRYGEVFELYLHPVFQGVGLGSRLFECARQRFVEQRLDGFFVRALTDNAGACRFYEGRGGRLAFHDVELFSGRPYDTVSYFWRLRAVGPSDRMPPA
jgi:ribosomal protein S18 acetylase RimI-like enzyme